jgi:hypothetical protein
MTKTRSICLALLTVLLSPMAANADLITWEAGGLISEVDGSSSSEVGDEFRVLINFDTNALLERAQTGGRFGAGTRYEYGASGVSFLVSLEDQADQLITPVGGGINLLWLRDNSADRDCCEFDEVDGLTFALLDADGYGLSIILRGSILDIFNNGDLPTDPDPRLVDLEIAVFQWTAEDWSAIGNVSSISRVPEPGTLALLGIGLFGMGLARRKKV